MHVLLSNNNKNTNHNFFSNKTDGQTLYISSAKLLFETEVVFE